MSVPQGAARLHVCLVFTVTLVVVLLMLPAASSAQTGKETHWGVRVSFAPSWEINNQVRKLLFEDDEDGTISGSEIGVGFVRGSRLGGDWGVSFVRKPWDDGSGSMSTNQDCFNQAQTICRPRTESTLTQGVYLNAVEIHWFARFVNIKERVQIGLNVAGGIGSVKGNVISTTDRFEPTAFNQQGPTAFRQVHEEEILLAKDELLPMFPLFKLEALGSVTVAPGLKVQVAAGANFPAYSARIGVVYLFGVR